MGEDEYVGCPSCHAMSHLDEVLAYNGCCPFCGARNHELDERYTDSYHYYGSKTGTTMSNRRTADSGGSFDQMNKPAPGQSGGGGAGTMFNPASGFASSGGAMTGQEDTPAFNPGPKAPSLFGPAGQGVNTNGGGPSLFGPNGGTEYPSDAPAPQGGTNGAATSGMMPLDWGSPVSGGTGKPSGQNVGLPASSPLPNGWPNMAVNGIQEGQLPAPPQTPSPDWASNPSGGSKTGTALRVAAIDFIAGENVTDRGELLFRAHRHASNMTCRMPVPVAQRVVRDFVAAVNREIAAASKSDFEGEPCEDCGAEAGEKCRPWCTGEAKYDDEQAEKKRRKSHRTASVIADFPDELMF